MLTYEDLLAIGDGDKTGFIIQAINQHKASDLYTEAVIAYDYFRRRNVTINEYQKLLYTMSGDVVPDNYSANYKFCNSFFQIFITQEASYLLGNGVTFDDDATKDRLGKDFDENIFELGLSALWGGVSFGFWNLDHIDTFTVKEFCPLIGEEDGALHAGIRFWQVDPEKPLRATLYEEDGYTDYIWRNKGNGEILNPKRAYKLNVQVSAADGVEILDGENYPDFPIVPMWGNPMKQSELTGLREKIDGYDLIQSGFANDLDDASQIYWTIQNAGGMDDIDLAKFLERLKVVKAAVVDENGSQAQAHTLEIPYAARQQALIDIKDSLYRDAMALDTERLSAGNVTATAIQASYSNLDLKCDLFEKCVTTFIDDILELAGIEDVPTYQRNRILNATEEANNVLAAANYIDEETILRHLPFLTTDEIEDVMQRKSQEEAEMTGVDNSGGEMEAGFGEEGEEGAGSDSDTINEDVIAKLEKLLQEVG